jgi:fimbrial isopeptide formation D2 family protein
MKKMRKFSTWILMLAMVFNVFAGMALPVHAEEKGSIRITKYQITTQAEYDALANRADGNEIAEGELPQYAVLSGVTFTLQKVNYKSGMTAQNASIDTSFPMQTVVTGEDGKASFESLDRGVYLLKEANGEGTPEEIRGVMEPVLIQIPMANEVHKTDESAPEYLWDIYVYPKNLTDPYAPKVEKHVVEYGNMHAGMNIGDSFPWIITAEIPTGVETGSLYRITDQLDTRLDFDTEAEPTVTIPTADGGTKTLEKDTHYTFSRDTDSADGRLLTFDFTEAGRQELATAPDDNRKVTVTFHTKINDTVVVKDELGVAIPNKASLDFTNSTGGEYHTESDEPDVYTGGYTLLKVDGITKEALEGAEFGIFATQKDAEDAVKENAIQLAESGEDGYVKFVGLEYGELGDLAAQASREYWIAETKAPVIVKDGVETEYNLLRKPYKVIVTATSHKETDDVLVIENNKTFQLPFTGGVGTLLFTIGGIVLAAVGGMLFMKGGRKEQI